MYFESRVNTTKKKIIHVVYTMPVGFLSDLDNDRTDLERGN